MYIKLKRSAKYNFLNKFNKKQLWSQVLLGYEGPLVKVEGTTFQGKQQENSPLESAMMEHGHQCCNESCSVPQTETESDGLLIDTHGTFDISTPEELNLPRDIDLLKTSQANQQI